MARPNSIKPMATKNRPKAIESAKSVYNWRLWDVSQTSPKKNERPLKSSKKTEPKLNIRFNSTRQDLDRGFTTKKKPLAPRVGNNAPKTHQLGLAYLVQTTQRIITCTPCLDINYIMSAHNVWFLLSGGL